MSALSFAVRGAFPEPYAAAPTLTLQLTVSESTGEAVHAVALRVQIMIEPQRRTYDEGEEERLVELFGETPRWAESLRPFLWTQVSLMVPAFTGSVEIDLPVPCSYDLEVSAGKYFHALDGGVVPLRLLFAGTVFGAGPAGFHAEPVAWREEAEYRLPAEQWRAVMDAYFPNSGWLRLHRDTIDALQRFKAARALPTWDDAMLGLLKEAGEDAP